MSQMCVPVHVQLKDDSGKHILTQGYNTWPIGTPVSQPFEDTIKAFHWTHEVKKQKDVIGFFLVGVVLENNQEDSMGHLARVTMPCTIYGRAQGPLPPWLLMTLESEADAAAASDADAAAASA